MTRSAPAVPGRAAVPASAAKVQRWLDIVAALLRRSYPVSFRELARDVPWYAARLDELDGPRRLQETAIMRAWERDKAELRALGVPIVTGDERHPERADAPASYALARRDFYLPFLCCATTDAAARAQRLPRHAPAVVRLTPDELVAVRRAARRVAALGDPALTAAARRAVATLSHDLATLDPDGADDGETVVPPAADPRTLHALGEALATRRAVRVTYHSIGRDRARSRLLEPVALAFLGGQWYCLARDPEDAGRPKQFRVSRMHGVAAVGASGAVAPMPPSALADLARVRLPWDLGDGDAVEVRVRVRSEAAAEALPMGARPSGARRSAVSERVVSVRRPDAFLRWLLRFAGDAVPVAPPPVVARWHALVRETMAAHAAPDPPAPAAPRRRR